MKSYYHLQIVIVGVFVSYAVLGTVARVAIGPPGEIFPVFTWCLFCRVPNEVQDYALRILTINDEELDPAPYFQDAGQWFWQASESRAYSSIQKLGAAVSSGDRDRIAAIRRFAEPLYFGNTYRVRYEVVVRSFNPLHRWKHQTLKSVRRLGVFESSGVTP